MTLSVQERKAEIVFDSMGEIYGARQSLGMQGHAQVFSFNCLIIICFFKEVSVSRLAFSLCFYLLMLDKQNKWQRRS